MTAGFARVDLDDVSRHFGRRRAVSHVSLSLAPRDIVGLLGPNGAGKSTLIGMMATLVRPSSGAVRFDGTAIAGDGAGVRRRIGLLAHELQLYPELSARQNLEFFARLYGFNDRETVNGALESAGLTSRADDEVATFSRGMRQRLALERALLHRPGLLLLDEPFTGLDDRAVGTVAARLRRLSEEGTIVVVATHDLDIADGLITRVAVIRGGALVCDEAASAGLRNRYRSLVGAA